MVIASDLWIMWTFWMQVDFTEIKKLRRPVFVGMVTLGKPWKNFCKTLGRVHRLSGGFSHVKDNL